MLLAYAAHGAQYVGDEWVYLTADGQRMYGLPEPIRLWKWHFDSMPEYWPYAERVDRAKLKGLDWVSRGMDALANGSVAKTIRPFKGLGRATPLVKRQLNVQIPPERLFGGITGPRVSSPSKLFFVASHETDDVAVEAADPVEVARRMVFSFIEEHADFLSYYQKFRFAFPERSNALLETLEERVQGLLLSALGGKEAHAVYHPHPAPIPALYDATHSLFGANH